MIINSHEAVLKALGNLKHKIIDNCPECGGKELGCKCRFKMLIYEQAAKANVPLGVLSKKFEDFGVGQDNNEVVQELKGKWHSIIYDVPNLMGTGKVIVVSGGNGTGKTMMACITIKSAIASSFSTQYVLFSQLVDAYLHKDDDDLVDHVLGRDLVVIDEIGKEYKKTNQFGEYDQNSNMAAYCRYVFEHIIKVRADAGLLTILVTNDTPEEIEAKYGGVGTALSSLLHSSNTEYLYHTGIDFRSFNV